MNKKLLALYGLKWNPFSPELPTEALHVTPPVEHFCWRIEQNLIQEGGFALISGDPGTGKRIVLRLLADRLAQLRELTVGAIAHPSSNLADFYREMGDLFGVELKPHNRWGGVKWTRPLARELVQLALPWRARAWGFSGQPGQGESLALTSASPRCRGIFAISLRACAAALQHRAQSKRAHCLRYRQRPGTGAGPLGAGAALVEGSPDEVFHHQRACRERRRETHLPRGLQAQALPDPDHRVL